MSDSIEDIATRHQVLLERLKSGKAKDYLKVAKKFDGELITKLNKLGVDSLDQLTKKELNSIVRYSTKLNQKYQKVIVKDLNKDLESLAKSDSIFEQQAINSVVTGANAVSAANIAFSAALAAPISATGELLEPFIKNWSKTRINQVNGAIRKGYKEGATLSQMTQRLRGTKANNFKDGLTNLRTRQAEAVIRTSVQHVSTTARLKTWERNKDIIEKYKWRATLDGRTTQQCRSLDGQEFEVGKGNPLPPIHIGCRSTINFVVKSELGLDALDEGATRSSLSGSVPANQTYYDWLKTQPKPFQRAAIGRKKTEWLNDGRLKAKEFAKLNLDKNFKPLTLDQMQRKRSMVLGGKQGAAQKLLDKEYPRINPNSKTSLGRFMDKKGNLTPERQALHDDIVESFFSGSKPIANPVARMTGGGPASGKSVLTNTGKIKLPKNIVKIDTDEIKKFLPEYNLKVDFDDFKAAAFAHDESSLLGKRIMKKAAEQNRNLFLDGTGDSSYEKLAKKVKVMRSSGQKVVADYVTVDTAEAIRRNEARFRKTGRMVPNSFVSNTHSNISKILPEALENNLFDEVNLWDTNTQGKTIKVMSSKDGKTTIFRKDLWERFLSKA